MRKEVEAESSLSKFVLLFVWKLPGSLTLTAACCVLEGEPLCAGSVLTCKLGMVVITPPAFLVQRK